MASPPPFFSRPPLLPLPCRGRVGVGVAPEERSAKRRFAHPDPHNPHTVGPRSTPLPAFPLLWGRSVYGGGA